MVVRNVRILNDAVTTAKIAADTVIPADIDETQAFAFSSTSGSWSGRVNAAGTLTATSGSITNLIDSMTVETNKTIDGVDVGTHIHTGGTSAGLLTTGWSSQTSTFAGAISSTAQGVAINFTSASGTFAGRVIGLIDGSRYTAGTAIVEALNISSASGTYSGVIISSGSYTGLLDGSNWSAGTAIVEALDISAAGGTFAGVATGAIKGTLDNSHWTAGTAIVEAINYSSVSSTFAGECTGILASTLNPTTAIDFSSANSTFAGRIIGLADGISFTAGTELTTALNLSSVSGTFVGVVNSTDTTSTIGNLRASLEVQGLEVSIVEGSTDTNFSWTTAFTRVPIVAIACTASTANQVAVYPTATGGTIVASIAAASTYNLVGVYGY